VPRPLVYNHNVHVHVLNVLVSDGTLNLSDQMKSTSYSDMKIKCLDC